MKDRGIYEVGKPFYIKVVFTGDEINPETDNIISKAMLRGEELLPGLELRSIFAKFVDKDLLIASEITEDLRQMRNTFEDFVRKYNNISGTIREDKIEDLKK